MRETCLGEETWWCVLIEVAASTAIGSSKERRLVK